jgi:anti-anti-sigma factor
MEIQSNTLDNGIRLIQLVGKLDITGTRQIESKFKDYCSGDEVRVIVDLSGVNLLTSIGIRLLTITAKSVAKRNGKMALVQPNPEVQNVLELTRTPEIIPLYSYLESAETVLLTL